GGDGDFLFLTGAEVLRIDVEDAVGVDVKGDFDLRDTTGRGREVGELELADGFVIAAELAFALEDVNLDAGLIVAGGGKNLRLAGGDGGVALDEAREDAAERLDA